MDKIVIRLINATELPVTPFDGQYVVEYDPNRRGVDPSGQSMLAHLRTSPDIEEALEFDTLADAFAFYRQRSIRWPTRPDGRPNRPLTTFTADISKGGD